MLIFTIFCHNLSKSQTFLTREEFNPWFSLPWIHTYWDIIYGASSWKFFKNISQTSIKSPQFPPISFLTALKPKNALIIPWTVLFLLQLYIILSRGCNEIIKLVSVCLSCRIIISSYFFFLSASSRCNFDLLLSFSFVCWHSLLLNYYIAFDGCFLKMTLLLIFFCGNIKMNEKYNLIYFNRDFFYLWIKFAVFCDEKKLEVRVCVNFLVPKKNSFSFWWIFDAELLFLSIFM